MPKASAGPAQQAKAPPQPPAVESPAPAGNGTPVGGDLAERMQRLAAQAPQPGVQSDRQAEDRLLGSLGKLDFSGIQSGQFRILPTDLEYESEIKSVQATVSKSSNNDMLALQLEVIHPPEFAGTRLFDQCVLVETSMWKLKSLLEATGLLGEDGRFAGNSLQELIGYAVRHAIRHDEYQGAVRNKIAGGYSQAYEASGLTEAAQASEATGAPSWA